MAKLDRSKEDDNPVPVAAGEGPAERIVPFTTGIELEDGGRIDPLFGEVRRYEFFLPPPPRGHLEN